MREQPRALALGTRQAGNRPVRATDFWAGRFNTPERRHFTDRER